jgi:type I site-specific restriction-modification system R (restriction) subunit
MLYEIISPDAFLRPFIPQYTTLSSIYAVVRNAYDRNELEDQMLKNLAAVGMANVAHADSMAELTRLLRQDYRGIVVSMIHKFRDMPPNINERRNIFVLIDEAHRTTNDEKWRLCKVAWRRGKMLGVKFVS